MCIDNENLTKQKDLEEPLLITDEGVYISKNKFWDKWFQKLFAQMISVKLWALAVITVLIFMGFITGSEFIIGFSLIIGAKGSKDLADKIINKNKNEDVIDKV